LRENGKEIVALIRYGEELPCSSHGGEEEGKGRGEALTRGSHMAATRRKGPGCQRKGRRRRRAAARHGPRLAGLRGREQAGWRGGVGPRPAEGGGGEGFGWGFSFLFLFFFQRSFEQKQII